MFEQFFGGEQESGRAIPALCRAEIREGLLQGMKVWPVSHPFDGGDLAAFHIQSQHQAGQDGPSIYKHSTRAALTQFTSVLGASQAHVFSQNFKQRLVRRKGYFNLFTVDDESRVSLFLLLYTHRPPVDSNHNYEAQYSTTRMELQAHYNAGMVRRTKVRHRLRARAVVCFAAVLDTSSGGGGLVSTAADYSRFCQMVVNGGELDGVRILAPASIELMGTNQISQAAMVNANGSLASLFNEGIGFGLDFLVNNEPRRAGSLVGKGTLSWGGAAGTWFWIDPTNDVIFIGMIQRFGSPGGVELVSLSRTLVYQALVDPKK